MGLSTIDVGWLSILPPIIAIGLALITKEVISSLLIGILTGTMIYSFATGTGVINSYMPNLTSPGAVKKGEVELVAGVALKNTLKAAVLNGIGIKPKTA